MNLQIDCLRFPFEFLLTIIMLANLYRAFEAFSISNRSSSIDIVKHDVMFLDKILRLH